MAVAIPDVMPRLVRIGEVKRQGLFRPRPTHCESSAIVLMPWRVILRAF
jgi:hypothetical protein